MTVEVVDETPGAVPVTSGRRKSSWWVAVAVTLAMVVAGAAVVLAGLQAQELRETQAELVSAKDRIGAVESALADAVIALSEVDTEVDAAARDARLSRDFSQATSRDLASLSTDLFGSSRRIRSARSGILNDLADKVDDMAKCVNDYMDTIAASGNGSRRYTYYYC
jgi:hypothetical protein